MPDSDDARRLEELFHRAADLGPAEREALLARECAGEPALADRVRRLLAEHDAGTRTFLRRELAGEIDGAGRIGRYRVLEPLGAGGMGAVWLAEQDEPVRRKVAIKTLKEGLDTADVLSRFEAEREVLQLMDHPGIARVVDGGQTASGRPYFVMEYVPGMPITEFCDHFRLDLDRRLELFAGVCDAVQHAHAKGIIHRDLKPGNILVMQRDGGPRAKVIDFGVARAVGQSLVRDALHQTGSMVLGSALWMSPEQADPRGLDLDTRSDLYALGVVLYELLTGAHPFDLGSMEIGGLLALQTALRDVEPERASRRVRGLAAEVAAGVARARCLSGADALARRLEGDLDWILVRALEKDRERRYPTAHELKADLRRHRDDEPVAAGPPTTAYLARKFVRRHRVGVALGLVLAATVLAGVAGTAVGLLRARTAQAQEARQRRAAEALSEHMRARAEFLDLALLHSARGGDLAVGELLDRGVEGIADQFAGRPVAEGYVRFNVGRAYLMLGRTRAALEQMERAYAIQRRVLEPDDVELFDTLEDLVHLRRVVAGAAAADEPVAALLDFARRRVALHAPGLAADLDAVLALATAGERPDPVDARERLDTLLERPESLPVDDVTLRITLRAVAEVGLALQSLWGLDEVSQHCLLHLLDPASDMLPEGSFEALLVDYTKVVQRLLPEDEPQWAAGFEQAVALERAVASLPSRHWLRADATRLRGLALARLGRLDEAEEAMLAAWRESGHTEDLARTRETRRGPAQLLAVARERGELDALLDRSLARWLAAGFEGGPCPWWVLDQGLGPEVGAAALAAVERAAPAGPTGELLVALARVRAGRPEEARAVLERPAAAEAESARLGFLALTRLWEGDPEGAREAARVPLTDPDCQPCAFREELADRLR